MKSTWFSQKIRSDIVITDLAYILHLCGVCSGGHIFLPSHEAGVAQEGAIFPVSFCLLLNDIPTPSLHTELAQYADDTALVAMSKLPAHLIKYLETHLADLEIWLREWRIAINVGKSSAALLTTRHILPPGLLRFLGEVIRCEEKVKYLGVTLNRRLA